jgi:hypothetical protein
MLLSHLTLLVALSSPVASPFQNAAADKAQESKEMQSLALNLDLVTRAFMAMHELSLLPKSEADLRPKDGNNSADSYDSLARAIDKSPRAKDIASAHGFTPHTLSLTFMTMVQTGLAIFALDAGAKMSDVLTNAQVNPANIAFYRDHKPEVDALLQKYPLKTE